MQTSPRILLFKATGIPLDKGYEELDALFDKLRSIHDVLSDPAVSSVRLVANPEKMVLEETRRAYTYLQLYGYGVDSVIVNRIVPASGAGTAFKKYVAAQAGYLDEIEGSFAPLPIFHVPHLGEEVFGLPLLREIGDRLYGDRDPTDVFYDEPTYTVEADEDAYVLSIRLPLTEEADFTTSRFGDQLVIHLENQRRNYLLPRFLMYYTLVESTLEEHWLSIPFEPTEAET